MNYGEIKDILRILMDRDPNVQGNENELSRLTDVHQPTIHRILTGESRDPRTATLQPLADYFRVSIAQLRGESPLDDAEEVPAILLEQAIDFLREPRPKYDNDALDVARMYSDLPADVRGHVRGVIEALATAHELLETGNNKKENPVDAFKTRPAPRSRRARRSGGSKKVG